MPEHPFIPFSNIDQLKNYCNIHHSEKAVYYQIDNTDIYQEVSVSIVKSLTDNVLSQYMWYYKSVFTVSEVIPPATSIPQEDPMED